MSDDFINIRGGDLVDQAEVKSKKANNAPVKEEGIKIADIWKDAEEKAKALTVEAEDLIKNTKTNIFDIVHDFEEKHGIKIVSFECGGTLFDRKLGNAPK